MATSTSVDKIEAGLARRNGRRSSLELMRAAPKTLSALVALAQQSDTKLKNLSTRATGYKQKIRETEAAARADFADTIPEKREEKIKERIAKTVEALAFFDKGESAHIAKAITYNNLLGQAVAGKFRTPLGYLMVCTLTGDQAAKRRDTLTLVADAGAVEIAQAIEASLQGGEDAAAMLAACAQRVNRLDKASRDELMPLLRDAAEALVGIDVRTAQAAIAQMNHAALAARNDLDEINGRPLSQAARIESGMAKKQFEELADAIDPKTKTEETI